MYHYLEYGFQYYQVAKLVLKKGNEEKDEFYPHSSSTMDNNNSQSHGSEPGWHKPENVGHNSPIENWEFRCDFKIPQSAPTKVCIL